MNNRRRITADEVRANIERHKEDHRRRVYEAWLAGEFWGWAMGSLAVSSAAAENDCGCGRQA